MTTLKHWIAGQESTGVSARVGEVNDPSTGEVIAKVPLASAADVDDAVSSARGAAARWANTPLGRRTEVLFAFRQLAVQHADELARLISTEHGKTLDDALGEVQRGIEVIEFACGIPHLMKGEFSENVSTAVDTFTMRQPVGVVAGITPFNFPAMVPMWMFPLAIACGNSFVLKPSEKDPSASMLLARLFAEAGLPPGVFNVVHGDAQAVNRLLEHPDIEAVSFVGSTPVAGHVYATASEHGKRVQALGGAKNHLVVLPDADLDEAADAIISSAYGSAGERCMAISAVVTVGDVADLLIAALSDRISSLKVAPWTDPEADMGPLITREHRDRVVSYLDRSQEAGAHVRIDGREHELPNGDGYWLGPCLVDHVSTEMDVYRDEVFGPVLAVLRTQTLADAIELLNRNRYGNGTAIFTRDGGAAREFQHRVEVGMIGVNVPIPVPVAYHSFGGWKDSLLGDHHVYGPDGIRFYTRAKAVTARWVRSNGLRLEMPTSID